MKTETKLLGIILLAAIVLIFGAVFFLGKNSGSPKNTLNSAQLQIDYSKGQKIGTDSARITLVEFSDFQCPACAAAEPFVKKVRLADSVQLIYRHFPLPQHTYAKKTAYLSEVASEEGKFWEMHDRIFETQSQWSVMSESDATSFFLSLAKELGLNEDKVKEALDGNKFKSKVDEDQVEGQRLGVNSTPTFFLNGRKLNLQSFADLSTIVLEELKK